MEQTEKQKETRNLNFICLCISYGAEIKEIDRTDRKRIRFVLQGNLDNVWVLEDGSVVEKSLDLDEMEKYFFSQKVLSPPNIFNIQKNTKSIIYAE